MIDIDLRSRTPIYEQIKEQIMRYIQLGVFRPHEQLPSIRTLSRELNLNINTVKHAFMDLEAYGVIYSLPGKNVSVGKALAINWRYSQRSEKSPAAFDAIQFISYVSVDNTEYYAKRKARDDEARAAYRAELEKDDLNGLYMRDILREELTPDAPRLR